MSSIINLNIISNISSSYPQAFIASFVFSYQF